MAEIEAKSAVISIEGGDPLPATVAVIDGDTVVPEAIEAVAEVAEAASSDGVEIARIEADARVTIAAIRAETETTAIEARRETDAEVAAMRERITWLEAEMTNTAERNRELEAEIAALSTPPALPLEPGETLTVEPNPETGETTVTLETTLETSSLTATEAPSESVDGSPAEPPAPEEPARKRRLVRFL